VILFEVQFIGHQMMEVCAASLYQMNVVLVCVTSESRW
jgi:hypothetical protein